MAQNFQNPTKNIIPRVFLNKRFLDLQGNEETQNQFDEEKQKKLVKKEENKMK